MGEADKETTVKQSRPLHSSLSLLGLRVSEKCSEEANLGAQAFAPQLGSSSSKSPGCSSQPTAKLMEIPAVEIGRGGWGRGERAAAGPGQKVSCRHLRELSSSWFRSRHTSLPPNQT